MTIREGLTFDDVLIVPKFSTVKSRKEVSLWNGIRNEQAPYPYIGYWQLPIISSNMDTVTGPEMTKAMFESGALSCLHRFWSIEDNVEAFVKSGKRSYPSIGIGEKEMVRANALISAGARTLVIDVAHGATKHVANHYVAIKHTHPDVFLIVGNFATGQSVLEFQKYISSHHAQLDGIKVGVGPGAACTTRIKTGCGYPQLSAIMECSKVFDGLVIADGGIKNSGDVAKALAAGAHLVMCGNLLAGTLETPGEIVTIDGREFKKYRGSASKESYEDQNKDWACAEGEAFLVPYKGSVKPILAEIEAGLKSAFSYVGAKSVQEFMDNAEFVRVTNAGYQEGLAHGKSK